MRLRLALAALILVVLLAAPAGALPVGGAEPTPTPGYWFYLPIVSAPPAPNPLPTVTPTRAPAAACNGDETVSFAPSIGATGGPVVVSVTSARPSTNVDLQVSYGGAAQPVTWQGVTTGGKGYIWSWTFTPAQPGQYVASFFVDGAAFCASAPVQVTGSALPTATPLPTVTPTPTPVRSAACMGDEEMSFAPPTGATGSQVAVSVTSARPSANVALQVVFQGAAQTVNWGGVIGGGKGYIWTWTFMPYQPGWHAASFYVNNTDFCAGGAVLAEGLAIPTPTPAHTATPTRTATPPPGPTATPTPAPTAPPGPWTGTGGSPSWASASTRRRQRRQRLEGDQGSLSRTILRGGGDAIPSPSTSWTNGGNRLSLPGVRRWRARRQGGQSALEWTRR